MLAGLCQPVFPRLLHKLGYHLGLGCSCRAMETMRVSGDNGPRASCFLKSAWCPVSRTVDSEHGIVDADPKTLISLSIFSLVSIGRDGERGSLVVNASDSGSRGRRFESHSGQTMLCP